MWSDKYIGIPFKEGGRVLEEGLDCFGLAKYVYKKELGIDLPDYNIFYKEITNKIEKAKLLEAIDAQINNAGGSWVDIKKLDNIPKDYDGVLIRFQGKVIHIGLYVHPDMILHCYEGVDVVLERLDTNWKNRIEKIIRWKNHI